VFQLALDKMRVSLRLRRSHHNQAATWPHADSKLTYEYVMPTIPLSQGMSAVTTPNENKRKPIDAVTERGRGPVMHPR
jgi:hypothetical protein